MDLTEFITARLDERERRAKAALADLADDGLTWDGFVQGRWKASALAADDDLFDYIDDCDPARVLREVEAKRRILDDYRITAGACRRMTGPELDTPGYRAMCAGRDAFRSACASLAKAWSDHPDYQEWA